MDIVRKTVSFGENDHDLLEFCLDNSERKGKKFAAFVKEVLREKMNQGDLTIKNIIRKEIAEFLKDKNIKIDTQEKAITEFKKEDKTALSEFFNQNKK